MSHLTQGLLAAYNIEEKRKYTRKLNHLEELAKDVCAGTQVLMEEAADPHKASGIEALAYAEAVREFATMIVEITQRWKNLRELRNAEEAMQQNIDSAQRLMQHAEVSSCEWTIFFLVQSTPME